MNYFLGMNPLILQIIFSSGDYELYIVDLFFLYVLRPWEFWNIPVKAILVVVVSLFIYAWIVVFKVYERGSV